MSKDKNGIPMISAEEAEGILTQVFEDCYEDKNSIPVEQLQSYANYRKERIGVQRNIAILALIIFVLMPLWFVLPRFNVVDAVIGPRGYPIYEVSVKGLLPIKSVTATSRNISMPIYQRSSRDFIIEPTKTGNMEITVALFNGLKISQNIKIEGLEENLPEFLGSSWEGETLYVYAEDLESGIDYPKVYAKLPNGEELKPIEYDEEQGYISFQGIQNGTIIYVPDRYGNELALEIK